VFLYCISEMRDKLRKWREENYRNSEQIVDVGEELINEHASKLGDDSKYNYSKQKLMVFIIGPVSGDVWLSFLCTYGH